MTAAGAAARLRSAARPRLGPGARAVLALAPATLAIACLFGAGLLGALRSSLGVSLARPWSEADLDAYRLLVEDPAFGDAVAFTLRIAALSTLISTALAIALAAGLRRRGALARGLAGLPVPMPHLLVAVLCVLWLGPGGIADRALGTLPVDLVRDGAGLGVVLVYVIKETPFLALLVLAAWSPEVAAREEAAAVHGATPLQRLRWVLWPALRGPLLTGAVVVAAFTLGAFEVPLVIGPSYPETLPELALGATKTASLDGRSVANAALLVTSLATILMAVVAARGLRRAYG
jgi:putative spermidine/putrescine transport system permease protein